MPFDPPSEITGGETWIVSAADGDAGVYFEVRITPGVNPESLTSSEIFQQLVDHMATKYELYAARRSFLEYRCTPELPEGA